MFGKLLKYDLKETARANLLILIISTSIMLFNIALVWLCLYASTHSGAVLFLEFFDLDTIGFLLEEGVVIIAIVVPFIITIITLIYFLRTSYGQAGYLTRLIPAKQTSVFNSKLLTTYLWILISLIISCSAVVFLFWMANEMSGDQYSLILSMFGFDFDVIWDSLPIDTKLIIVIGIGPLFLLDLLAFVMFFIYAFTLAQKKPFRRLGFGGVMIWIGILYVAFQVFLVISLCFPWQVAFDSSSHFTIVLSEMWSGVSEGYGEENYGISLLGLIAPPAFAAITYFYCKKQYSTNINMK